MPLLVMTRREGEEIVIIDTIGNEIARVRVARIRGDKIRLAVEASLRFGVHRSEVLDAIRAERAVEGKRAEKAGAAA